MIEFKGTLLSRFKWSLRNEDVSSATGSICSNVLLFAIMYFFPVVLFSKIIWFALRLLASLSTLWFLLSIMALFSSTSLSWASLAKAWVYLAFNSDISVSGRASEKISPPRITVWGFLDFFLSFFDLPGLEMGFLKAARFRVSGASSSS